MSFYLIYRLNKCPRVSNDICTNGEGNYSYHREQEPYIAAPENVVPNFNQHQKNSAGQYVFIRIDYFIVRLLQNAYNFIDKVFYIIFFSVFLGIQAHLVQEFSVVLQPPESIFQTHGTVF